MPRNLTHTRQPQYPARVNLSHPLARDMFAYYEPGSNISATLYDLTGQGRDLTLTGTAPSSVTTNAGMAIREVDTGYYSSTHPDFLTIPTENFTVVIWTTATAYAANAAALSWYGTDDLILYPHEQTTGASRLYWRDLGGSSNGTINITDGTIHMCSLVSYGATDHKLYADGVVSVSSTGARSGAGPFTGFSVLAWQENTAQRANLAANSGILAVAIWKRALSQGELAALSVNPWQIRQLNDRRVALQVAAAGTGAATGDGVATASQVGAAANKQAATGDGVAVSSVVGASVNSQPATGDGVATASAVGASSNQQSATGDGVATSSINGISAFAGSVTSDGVATASVAGISSAVSVATGDGVATANIVSPSVIEAVASGDGVATSSIAGASATQDNTAGGGPKRKKRKKVWLVEIEDEYEQQTLEVETLEEVRPIVADKLLQKKKPKIKAKPVVASAQEAVEMWKAEDLAPFMEMPKFERRMPYINILPYLVEMQRELEEEETILLVA